MAEVKAADTNSPKEIVEFQLDKPQQVELEELLEECKNNLTEYDADLITKAFKLCYFKHKDTKRKSGEPYYLHPVAVAHIVCTEINIDEVSVVAALLHDVVEDTDVTLEQIRELFGENVSHLIDGVTKVSGLFKDREHRRAENYLKMLLTTAEDLRVVLIKFADRLHNMRTLNHLPREKQLQVANETMDLYAPLAHRFGLFNIKSELEDLCFKAIDPTSYKFIARKLREKKESREEFIDKFMEPIEGELNEQGYNFEIKGRPKHIYSIFRKMQRQQKPFEEIYDLFAIRIILQEPHTKEDCWRVYSIVTDWYTPIPKRFRDFISVPKANGYQSLHTTVITQQGRKVEIQIRTRKMDEIAEKGLAAHWKYKEGGEGSETIDRFVNWVRDALDNPRPDGSDPEETAEFIKDFQLNLNQDEIYVFTPKGELETLPYGATPIDFAFQIHSEVGERATAAKVNGKMVPLRKELKSGDQVEIITGNRINLNPDWIHDVVTHKAKSRIRQYVKQKKREVVKKGRELWEKRSKRDNIVLAEEDLDRIAKKLNYNSAQNMFYDIGSGTLDLSRMLDKAKQLASKGRIDSDDGEKQEALDEQKIQENFYQSARDINDADNLVVNDELTNVKYSYAQCCNPIPGDEVLGYISRGGDVKIHRVNCKNAQHLVKNESHRIVKVTWSRNIDQQFMGALKVIGEDRRGLLNDITNLISKSMETNMKSINVSEDSGMFEGILTIYVNNIEHLDKIINRLSRIEGIKMVQRYE